MPRRRMIDPNIWKDPKFAQLSDAEKILFVGIFSNADDEGRIIATPEALKAEIFPYDHKKTAHVVKKLRDSIATRVKNDGSVEKTNPLLSRPPLKNVILYQVDGVEYIQLLRWHRYQKPKHLKPSILPKSPLEPYLEEETSEETSREISRETSSPPLSPPTSRPSQGQSSLGKISIGKGSTDKPSGVQEDFRKFINSEKAMTDFVTTTLDKYIPRGPTWAVEVLQQLWVQILGERMKGNPLALTLKAVSIYPASVLAKAYVKAVKHGGGKYDTAKYLEKILKEKTEK